MKRLIALLLAAGLMVSGLTGCSGIVSSGQTDESVTDSDESDESSEYKFRKDLAEKTIGISVSSLRGNYMKVLSDDKWGIMNEELTLVIDCRFEFIYGIEDNAAIGLQFDDLSKRWLTFVIDLETCDCIKIPFDGCYGFKNGVAIVFKKKVSTVYGLINTKGETILPCEYQYIPFLDEDRLSAMLEIEKEREDVFGYSRKELDEMYLDALEGDPNNSSNIE